jgi:hypothetical protein
MRRACTHAVSTNSRKVLARLAGRSGRDDDAMRYTKTFCLAHGALMRAEPETPSGWSL